MGTPSGPGNPTISVDQVSLLKDGQPWLPAMGEIHYSRVDPSQWKNSLLLMRAGGLEIIASYVFWIHHEEIEGEFDFTGRRDLRKFAQVCADLKFPVIMRCGPWCHGEVRNGGLPDWILTKPCKPRSTDAEFLKYTQRLYRQIATQLKGLLWKDGGPVVGIQVDNEFGGPAEYLLELKKIAREEGLDVPIYTRTGWPSTSTPMPYGKLLPLFGAYAEGFWSRSLEPMPDHHWQAFRFEKIRTDTTVGADMLGARDKKDDVDTAQYPYLTCEVGGGMEQSYHRRVLIDPMDVLSTTLVKIGSGSTLPGYYMYHGGTNPQGKLSSMQESQATRYWNDSPEKSYDFQAPLGQFAQVRPQFHLLRRLHLFMQDFGSALTRMPVELPAQTVTDKNDSSTLRWSVRSDGTSGYVFVNNYQRLLPMPAREGVQFEIRLPGKTLCLPSEPTSIPGNSSFFFPFNMDIGVTQINYATAQPICRIVDGNTTTLFFAQITGLPSEFVLGDKTGLRVESRMGSVSRSADSIHVKGISAGLDAAIVARFAEKTVNIVLLAEAASLQCYKIKVGQKERIILSSAVVVAEDSAIRLWREGLQPVQFSVFPALDMISIGGNPVRGKQVGLFSQFETGLKSTENAAVNFTQSRPAGPAREIKMGFAKVAEAPSNDDWKNAAVWEIRIPQYATTMDALCRIHYVGDVARLTLDGKLITDSFYHGRPFDLSLKEFAPEIASGKLELHVLPLKKDAPIYVPEVVKEALGASAELASVSRMEIVERSWIPVRL